MIHPHQDCLLHIHGTTIPTHRPNGANPIMSIETVSIPTSLEKVAFDAIDELCIEIARVNDLMVHIRGLSCSCETKKIEFEKEMRDYCDWFDRLESDLAKIIQEIEEISCERRDYCSRNHSSSSYIECKDCNKRNGSEQESSKEIDRFVDECFLLRVIVAAFNESLNQFITGSSRSPSIQAATDRSI